MRRVATVLTIALVFALAAGILVAQQSKSSVPPPWAYGFATPPPPPGAPAAAPAPAPAPAPPDPTEHKLPGSSKSFTLAQVRDGFGPADWFPEDHPTMPDIVAHGRREAMINACSLCHYPN